jgi:hypothetical protein
MQSQGYDPIAALVAFAQDQGVSPSVKIDIARELLPYMYPKLSNIAVEGSVEHKHTHEVQHALVTRILSSPELSDAAQKLSLVAADTLISAGENPIYDDEAEG